MSALDDYIFFHLKQRAICVCCYNLKGRIIFLLQPLCSVVVFENGYSKGYVCWGCSLRGLLTEAKDCPVFNQYRYYLSGNDVDNYNTNSLYFKCFHNSLNIHFYQYFDTSFFFQIFGATLGGIVGVPLSSPTTTCP